MHLFGKCTMLDSLRSVTYRCEVCKGMHSFTALLSELDWTRESACLQRNMALGDAKHRRQVRDLFHDVRAGLADVVFGYAAQGGLTANDVLRLLDFLSKV